VLLDATSRGLTIAVRDRGPGIPHEHQARIFERYGRSKEMRSVGGTGLGLYICRTLAEAMGGSIRVDSAPQLGTIFTVQLPSAAAAPRSRGTNPERESV
jgi:signal transduction histidine kinase